MLEDELKLMLQGNRCCTQLKDLVFRFVGVRMQPNALLTT
jgi:hypothetical protein